MSAVLLPDSAYRCPHCGARWLYVPARERRTGDRKPYTHKRRRLTVVCCKRQAGRV